MFMGGESFSSRPAATAPDEKLHRLLGQQQAEREGQENVSQVIENIQLLEEFVAAQHDQDLNDFLEEWKDSKQKNTEAKGLLVYALYPIAKTLVPYIEKAQEWKQSQQQQPK